MFYCKFSGLLYVLKALQKPKGAGVSDKGNVKGNLVSMFLL